MSAVTVRVLDDELAALVDALDQGDIYPMPVADFARSYRDALSRAPGLIVVVHLLWSWWRYRR